MTVTIVAGMLMMVGLIGVVVPFASGLVLVVLGTVLWAFVRGDGRAWIVVGATVALYALGPVARYVLPGRRLRQDGVGTITLLLAVAIAVWSGSSSSLSSVPHSTSSCSRSPATATPLVPGTRRRLPFGVSLRLRALSWRPASRSCLPGWSDC